MNNQFTWVWMVVGFVGMLALLMFYNAGSGQSSDVKASANSAATAPVELPAIPRGGGGCGV